MTITQITSVIKNPRLGGSIAKGVGDAVTSHPDLNNRDLPGQHPAAAISYGDGNVEEVLDARVTTVNGKTATDNEITLTPSDIGADPTGTASGLMSTHESTYDHTKIAHTNRTALDAVSGTNTGDETESTIKTKLGITTLSGSNTGDQDLSGLVPKTTTVNGKALNGNISLDKTDIGLSNVPNTDATNASNISSGTLDGDRLPAMSATKKGAVPATGTPSGKVLSDGGTWVAQSGGIPDAPSDNKTYGRKNAGWSEVIAGTGDVVGPSSAVDGNFASFDSTTGKLIKDSGKKAADFDTAGAASTVQGNLDTHAGLTTTAHGGIVASNDPRLTDARTPVEPTSEVTSPADSDKITLWSSAWKYITFASLRTFIASYFAPIYTGFVSAESAYTITHDDTARTMTIVPTGASYTIANNGSKKVITTSKTSAAFDNTSGIKYFYFDSSSVLQVSTSIWLLDGTVTPVRQGYWNATLNAGAGGWVWLVCEDHPNTWVDSDWRDTHLTRGAVWRSGFAISYTATTGTPNASGVNTCIGLSGGTMADESLEASVTSVSSNPSTYQQVLGETTAANITALNALLADVIYKDSGGLFTRVSTNGRFQFLWNSGNNRPQYVTSGGVVTDVPDDQRFVYWLVSVHDSRAGKFVFLIPHHLTYATAAAANDATTGATWYQLTQALGITSSMEFKPLHKLVFRVNHTAPSAYDAAVKYTSLEVAPQDLRPTSAVVAGSSAALITTHAATHATGGGDEVTLSQSQITNLVTDLSGKEATGTAATAVTNHEATVNHAEATTSTKGMMSATDKTKLDAYPAPSGFVQADNTKPLAAIVTTGFGDATIDAYANNLVLYLPMSETSGNRVDLISGINAVPNTTTSSTTGKNGNAVNFDGSKYLAIDDAAIDLAALAATRNMTINKWVNVNSSTGRYIDGLVNGSNNGLINSINHGNVQGKIMVRAGTTEITYTSTPLGQGNWFMLTIVLTAASNRVDLYINGVSQANSTSITSIADASNDWLIGAENDNGTPYYGGTPTVAIDEYAIWNTPLSAAAITALYNSGSGKFASSVKAVQTKTYTASKAMVTDANGIPTVATATAAEIDYLSGVTSNIQTQINNVSGALPVTIDNLIWNGAFELNQLAAGELTVNSSTNQHPCDGWRASGISSDGVFKVQQQSTVAPTTSKYALKITATTADASIGSTDKYVLIAPVEGTDCAELLWGTANAKEIKVRFKVRSSVTGNHGASIQNAANDRSYPFTFNIAQADTWETKTITISGDTAGTWVTDTTGAGLLLKISIGAGTGAKTTANAWAAGDYIAPTSAVDLIATLNATMYIAEVEICQSSKLGTAYNFRPFDEIEQKGMRYVQIIKGVYFSNMYATGSSVTVGFNISKQVRMAKSGGTVTPYTPAAYTNMGTATYLDTEDTIACYAASSASGMCTWQTPNPAMYVVNRY